MKTAPIVEDDGYTIKDTIESGPFQGVYVELRPADVGEAQRFVSDPRKWEERAPEFLLSKIIKWNISKKSEPDTVLPITLENIAKQRFPLSERWVDLVIGYIVKRQDEADRKN